MTEIGAGRTTLVDRQFVRLLVVALAAFTSFQLLLSVVPLYTQQAGGGSAAAGLATMTLMLTTVLAQVQMPWLLRLVGYRTMMVAGLLFLGAPAFFYPASESVAAILVVTAVRGIGFGITTVVAAAMIADLVPIARRGEGIGLFGIATALPTIFGLPFGIWLAQNIGYPLVFTAGAVAPLLGVVAALGIRAAPGPRGDAAGFLSGLRRRDLLRPFLIFNATTVATGVVVTFLPLSAPELAAAALLLAGIATTLARWFAGRFGDRRGPHLLLAPGLVLVAGGMAALAQSGSAAVVLLGALLYGAGLGTMQNATLVLMINRVKNTEYGLASTLWNVAFDAGTGVGALAFGLVIGATGFAFAFYLTAGILLVSLILVRLDYLNTRTPDQGGPD